LLSGGTQGILDHDELQSLTSVAGPIPSHDQPEWASAVFAPMSMPGQAAGVIIYWRSAQRPPFSTQEADVLLTLTNRCTPLIVATALADHQLFDRDLADSLPEAIIAVDPDFRVLRWNPAAERLYGISAEDAIGNPLATLYFTHYDDPEMHTDRAWEELVRTDHWEGYVTQKSKAGRTVSVFASVTTVRDDLGRIVGAVAVNRDNSDIVSARSKVNLAESMLYDVLDAAGSMTVVLDGNGIIVAANREWLDVALATGAPMAVVSVGADYLSPVRAAVAAGDVTAGPALELLESVLSGSRNTGSAEYRCDRPDGPHWYTMDVSRVGPDRAIVVAHREVTDRHRLEVELAHGRTHDLLTDLGNRLWLEERVSRSMAEPSQEGREFGLIVCDVDGFSAINEALGYPSGDKVLRVVADRLRTLCPPTLGIVRLGGDQFAVFADSMWGAVPLVDVAERLRAGVAEPIDIDGRQVVISFSAGVAAAMPKNGDTPAEITSELINRADAARMDAKSQGRNRVRHYRPDLRDQSVSALLMRHDFSDALHAGTLELHYQQIRRLADESVIGYEALIRWPRPNGPLLTPASFAEMLDEPTIAGPLAQWTIKTAVEAVVSLREHFADQSVRVGLNVSARQFLDLDVAGNIQRASRSAGIPSSALVVEVTETATFTDNHRVVDQLNRIHDLGALIALDDFGTGFSSLTHLRALPVDSVKVDKTFTGGVGTDPTSGALVRALIALGHDLGLTVIAEGVETAAQRDWLAEAGCDYYQGFLAHRPARLADELAASGN
nr:EAL domain-containing protein [Candidatus Nanopelagicales bacterium]